VRRVQQPRARAGYRALGLNLESHSFRLAQAAIDAGFERNPPEPPFSRLCIRPVVPFPILLKVARYRTGFGFESDSPHIVDLQGGESKRGVADVIICVWRVSLGTSHPHGVSDIWPIIRDVRKEEKGRTSRQRR
jgi:hypothetical protein